MSVPAAPSQPKVYVALACALPAVVSTSSPGQANFTVHGSSASSALTAGKLVSEKIAMMMAYGAYALVISLPESTTWWVRNLPSSAVEPVPDPAPAGPPGPPGLPVPPVPPAASTVVRSAPPGLPSVPGAPFRATARSGDSTGCQKRSSTTTAAAATSEATMSVSGTLM